jgi:hypothetical protein
MPRKWYQHPIMRLARLAAVALLVGITTANISQIVIDVNLKHPRAAIKAAWRAGSRDIIAMEDKRYQLLRQVLQNLGVHGTIGYVTEVRPEELLDNTDWLRDFYLSQYALAPLTVSAVPGQSTYVIGNFRSHGTNLKGFISLEPLFDAGNGLVLFRRRIP